MYQITALNKNDLSEFEVLTCQISKNLMLQYQTKERCVLFVVQNWNGKHPTGVIHAKNICLEYLKKSVLIKSVLIVHVYLM